MKKRLMAMMVALTIISMAGPVAYATNEIKGNQKTTMLTDSAMLTQQEMEIILQREVNGYLSTEFDEPVHYASQDNWIPLYDFSNNLFAFVVPLLTDSESEVGYVVIGAIVDGYSTYASATNTTFLNNLRFELSNAESGAKIIYMPPFDYFVKEEASTDKYYQISQSTEGKKDVTEEIQQNFSQYVDAYDFIPSELNKAKNSQIMIAPVTTTPILDYRLDKEAVGEFVPIANDGLNKLWPINQYDYFYGGNQDWYNDSRTNTGCGPVAASNIMYYMSRSNSGYANLYPYSNLTKTNFINVMTEMYGFMNPSVVGEFSLNGFATDVWRYANSKGVSSLRSTVTQCNNNKIACTTTITNGISGNHPVAALNARVSDDKDNYPWHWVTITKYYQGAYDQRWIAISTWSRRESVDFDMYYDSMNGALMKGGFVYFY